MKKKELNLEIKKLNDFGFTVNSIEFKSLLITCFTQNEKGIAEYIVYGEDDESEDGIFKSFNSEEVVEFVFNY